MTNIVIGLLGGLALFLYGMQMMSAGLEAAAGSKMKEILEKLTSNRIKGVLVGAIITAVIQSSSATTVMVVGFVNSGMMTLRQAVWIIMGANIGTTITGQLIALDVGAIAPLIAFAGVAVIMFSKKEKVHHIASIFAGLGILFIGMDMMGSAMDPLRDNEKFVSIMTEFENPVLGIIAGMVFTAIIQSSSASVGILQTLAGSGIIGLDSAYFTMTSDIERVSDHAANIAGYARTMDKKGMKISEYAKEDVAKMKDICEKFADVIFEETSDVVDWHKTVANFEQRIDDMTEEFRNNMYTRMQQGICDGESHILFSEMVTDFERIGDHYLNISDEIMRIKLAGV